MSISKSDIDEKMPFEAAIDKAGFGAYSYIMTCMAGVCIISFACIGYGSNMIVPTSACELETTVSQQGLLAAGPVVGAMLGGVIWGYLADTRGRRPMLMVSLIGGAIFNLAASISINWIMLMILQFVASLFASGLYSMSMSILSESVPMAKRNLVVLLVSSIFLLSQGIMAVLAIPIIPLPFSIHLPALGIYWNSWRTLMVVYSCPSIITAIWLYFMQESPKFVFSKGDEIKALQILRTIHRVNNFRSKGELEVFGLLQEENQFKEQAPSSGVNQIMPMFRPPLVKYTFIMTLLFVFQQIGAMLVWLPRIADQFVTILQGGEGTDLTMCEVLGSDLEIPVDADATPCALNITSLLMVLGVGAMQSGVNILISLVVNIAGRRNIAMVVAAVCGVSGILVNLVPNAIGSAVLFAIFLMGIVVLGLYTAIMVSLFPTNLRVLAIAFAMTFGRMGVFASIQILNVLLENNCDVGFYIFSALFGSSAIVASFLPDDRRAQAPKPPPAPSKQDGEEHKTMSEL